MKRACLLLTSALLYAAAWAQSGGGDFEITRSVIAGGGGASSGGDFAVQGTLGQSQAGESIGGGFLLQGGFWASGTTADLLFASSFEA